MRTRRPRGWSGASRRAARTSTTARNQEQRLLKADVYVQQHAHLTQPRPKGWTEAKRAIVDEACFKERVRVSKLAYADIVQEAMPHSEGLLVWETAELAREGREALAYEGGRAALA